MDIFISLCFFSDFSIISIHGFDNNEGQTFLVAK